VERALEATIKVAIDEIDMERHRGEHPRIGAVDVIPFVPLAGTTIEEAVALARSFGARVADRFGIPVYLYARSTMSAPATCRGPENSFSKARASTAAVRWVPGL
jgi:glutamate formiminotransferase